MDRETHEDLRPPEPDAAGPAQPGRHLTRREALKKTALGLAGGGAACAGAWYLLKRELDGMALGPGGGGPVGPDAAASLTATAPSSHPASAAAQAPAAVPTQTQVFKGGAPNDQVWQQWNARGWVKEASHYLRLGRNVQCKLCPNNCLLEPGDRSRCRNRVNRDGRLYTMTYGNPCSFNLRAGDAIEKKPLYHFLPGTQAYSLATSGCGFRCLNCQNWTISQAFPEQRKDPTGEEFRVTPPRLRMLTEARYLRATLMPYDAVVLAKYFGCPSIAYTYSEPTVWFEYMVETARLARREKLRNVWVTCGYINPAPLDELCDCIDAANVDLKSFSEDTYRRLNSGHLQPILDCLTTLKRRGVWFEVTNLVVPTYTDKPEMIRRMCDWLLKNIGPDYPVHFSRFFPHHKLTHLRPTPIEVLLEAKDIARKAGLHYAYVGNAPEIPDGGNTYCPNCRKPVIERAGYRILRMRVQGGKCPHCGTKIAGVWA